MTAILTAAEMRALEQEAIARGEVTGLELMERAGRGVVEAILSEWPEIEQGARRAVVLCGPGNNGGDGFVVARLLKQRGWEVAVWFYGEEDRLPPDAKANCQRFEDMDPIGHLAHRPQPLDTTKVQAFLLEGGQGTCVVIDALFGIGLTRPLGGKESHIDLLLESLVSLPEVISDDGMGLPKVTVHSVAVDVPSGLCANSGRMLVHEDDGDANFNLSRLAFDLTVAFHRQKIGHLLADGPRACGKVVVIDIGLPQHAAWTFKAAQETEAYKRGLRKRTGHKYTHGHALILSGRPGRGGAARMTARGSLRIGAGLVTLAVPPAALHENAARLDAIMLRSVKDAAALTDLLSDPRYNALAVGPGFGTSDREAALLSVLLEASRGAGEQKPRALVLDADALTLLAKDSDLRAKLHDRCVLTPHEGEFARLFPTISEKWHAPATTGPAYSKVDAARDAARECGATVLLKGPDTVIASPDGRAAINAAVYERAAPWLATAGSGDVLAGFITGLLARGFQPFEAACTAAWLHVECARSFGPGLIAEDLPEELPKVFRSLGL